MDIAIIFLGILFVPCLLFTVINIICNKYKEIDNKKNLSGFEVAKEILDSHDLKDVYIVEIKGNLNDHYDYDQKVLRLSSDVFHGETITAAVVAARIAIYAIQDKNNYTYMKFRASLNKIITFVNYMAYVLFVIAICMRDISILKVANLAIILVFIFHLATLPVEFNANKDTKKELEKNSILTKKELDEASSLFNVSPYTFIMSIITCVSNLVSEIMYNIQRRG